MWSAGGAGHRPLEVNLGRRAGGDPAFTANTAKCVSADCYGRSFQKTPPQRNSDFYMVGKVLSQPDLHGAWDMPRGRSAASRRSTSTSGRASTSESVRMEFFGRATGRPDYWQFPEPRARSRWQMPMPSNTTYGSFHFMRQPRLNYNVYAGQQY